MSGGLVMSHRRRQDCPKVHALLFLLCLSVAAHLSPAEGRSRVGGRAGGGHIGSPRGGAVHARFSGGPHGGVGHVVHRGAARAAMLHPLGGSFVGLHRVHHPSAVFFNFGGFVYPSYPYYPPYPYYPMYPAYSVPYYPGYPGADYPYSYAEPVGASSQSPFTDVQVYTAPPEPPSAPYRQPAAPTLENLPPPPPLGDGSLRFEVSPPEAQIFVDDRYVGDARELANIAEITASAGRHLLEIRVGNEKTFTEVAVSPHRVTPVRWALVAPTGDDTAPSPENGRLRLQVSPPGAAIYLDGTFATVSESDHPVSLRLSPGQHRVQMVMPGHKGYAADVTVPDGGEAVIDVQLPRE